MAYAKYLSHEFHIWANDVIKVGTSGLPATPTTTGVSTGIGAVHHTFTKIPIKPATALGYWGELSAVRISVWRLFQYRIPIGRRIP
jgi:hypothetical protein